MSYIHPQREKGEDRLAPIVLQYPQPLVRSLDSFPRTACHKRITVGWGHHGRSSWRESRDIRQIRYLLPPFVHLHLQEQKDTYELALELQQHVMQSLKPGVSFSSIYEKAVEFLNTKKPSLLKHLAKSVGHAIGAQYRDTRLVFNQKNDKYASVICFV